MLVIRFEAFKLSSQEHYQIDSLQSGARSSLVTQKATEELVSSMIAPLSESILIAVVRLIDDSMVEPKRKPTHYDIRLLRRPDAGLQPFSDFCHRQYMLN